jgi:hypothetical protein
MAAGTLADGLPIRLLHNHWRSHRLTGFGLLQGLSAWLRLSTQKQTRDSGNSGRGRCGLPQKFGTACADEEGRYGRGAQCGDALAASPDPEVGGTKVRLGEDYHDPWCDSKERYFTNDPDW